MDSAPAPTDAINFAHLNVGSFVLSKGLIVSHWNETLEEWTGQSSAELIGRRLGDFFPLDARWAASVEQMIAEGIPAFLTSTSPIIPIGKTTATVSVATVKVDDKNFALLSIVASSDAREGATGAHQTVDHSANAVPEIRERLEELGMMDDVEFLTESLREFVASTQSALGDLANAISATDRAEMIRHAHRIAGASLTLGANELGRRASEFEMAVTSGKVDQIDAMFAQIEAEAARVQLYCEQLTP